MTNHNYPPAAGPYPYPQPTPDKKNFFARHKILTVIGAVIVLVIIGAVLAPGGNSEGDSGAKGTISTPTTEADTTTGQEAQPEPKPDAEQPVKLGTPAVDGKLEFTVTKIEPGVAQVGDEYLNQKAQGQFVLVHLTVKNTGTETESFSSANQYLYDQHGNKAEADAGAAVYLPDSNSLYEKINPGNTVTGIVVFDIAKDAVPTTVELHESMLTPGVKVSAS